MLLLILAGLWAVAVGRITITGSLSLEGRRARFYGLALLVAALLYGLLDSTVSAAIAGLAPDLAANEILGTIARVVVLIAIILGLVPLFRGKPVGTVVYES